MSTQPKISAQTMRYVQMAAAQPWGHGFLRMVRWFGARHQHLPKVGTSAKPSEEIIRLGQTPSLTFSPREIAQIDVTNQHVHIKTYGIGLWGANGPLPLHFSEIAMHRKDMQHDHTLTNFIDIFHHRSMSLLYRAWEVNQSTAGLDRSNDESFSHYLSWLTGNELSELASTRLPTHARLSASAHLKHQAKNPSAIAQSISHYFQVPVRLEEYHFHWISIGPDECTHLARGGRSGNSATLGRGAMLGAHVPDRQNAFMLTIGPLSLARYLRFLPNGQDLGALIDWVRAFIGLEYVWQLKLTVQAQQAEPMRLGEHQRLGWSTWIGGQDTSTTPAPVVGMAFEPENYATTLKPTQPAHDAA